MNRTVLDSGRLEALFRSAAAGWPIERLEVVVRYSRKAEFSGSCYYASGRIFINLGRTNQYPYRLLTHIAPARSSRGAWSRELYAVELASAYELALFIFLHELYHWLVKQARRNVRQKEGRCDRFATRRLVDHCGAMVTDSKGRPVPREGWDFQDLDGFVAAARTARPRIKRAARKAVSAPAVVPVAESAPAGDGQLVFGFLRKLVRGE